MPGFASLHDDGLIFITAKSLANGSGFRLIDLPEQPAQTKYPVLFPLLLSAIWRINPNFPDNLKLASLVCWLLLAACLALAWIFYRSQGFSRGRAGLMVALLGLNPYLLLFGSRMFSEVLFTCCILAAFIVARKEGSIAALLAGILAGCAYLTRTAGITMIVIAAVFAWQRQFRRAACFAAGMLPFVAGWSLWSRANIIHTADPTLIYYTDYIKYELLNVTRENIHIVIWRNLDGLLYSIGSLILPRIYPLDPVKILTQVLAVAAIAGTVRLALQGVAVPYALSALISGGILVFWHVIPEERLVLPLLPILLAGFLTEAEHIGVMIKRAFAHKDRTQRIIAAGLAAVFAGICVAAVATQAYLTFWAWNAAAASDRETIAHQKVLYDWIDRNVPPSASILSSGDTLVYLVTGRRGSSMFPLPRDWCYGDAAKGVRNMYRDVALLARKRNADYLYIPKQPMWVRDAESVQNIQAGLASNPSLQPVFRNEDGVLYRIVP